MNYKLPPLPESDHVINKFDGSGILGMGQVDGFTAEQMQVYAIAAIELQQEPVAWVDPGDFELMQSQGRGVIAWPKRYPNATMPLYTNPAQQEKPQPLSDEQMWKLWNAQGSDDMNQQEAIAFARAIEAAHGITKE